MMHGSGMHMGGGGHGGGGGRGGWGGAGGFNMQSDDLVLGKPYDHTVVTRLLAYAKPYRTLMIITALAIMAYTLCSVAIPWMIAAGIKAVRASDGDALNRIVLQFLGIAVLRWGSHYAHMILLARVTQGAMFNLRTELFKHLHTLSLSFFDKSEVGRIMSRVQNDVLTINDFLTQSIMSMVDLFTLGGIVVALFLMDVQLALITVTMAPLMILFMMFWQRRARNAFINVRQAISRVNSGLQENISGVRVIQSMNRQGENLKRFDKLNQGHLSANLDASRLSAFIMPVVEILMATAIALVLIFGGIRALDDPVLIAAVIAFVLYIQRFFDPIRILSMQYTELQKAMASGVRIFEVLDTKPEIVDRPDAIEIPQIKGEVKFEHVSHSYIPGNEVLHDFNLVIQPGETIALVGETGAGKTTITGLLSRFYEASEGRILIDGHAIRSVTMQSMARQVGIVLQEPFLFSDTVKSNIRYGHLDATDEEIIEAAKTVGAHDFIMRQEKGYDALLHERGGNLSIGQRQLISFARAVLANPRILILDEATANVDTYTEYLIQKALKVLLKDRTSVVIAHRLSTIRDAHKIIVMESGRIVEIGNHRELMNAKGKYHHLYTMNYMLEGESKPVAVGAGVAESNGHSNGHGNGFKTGDLDTNGPGAGAGQRRETSR